MKWIRGVLTGMAAVVASLAPSTLSAQFQDNYEEHAPEFSLGIGYANIDLDDSPVIESESALRIEPVLSFSPIQQIPQLRLGGNFGVTLVLENESRVISSGDQGLIYRGSSDIPLWLLEPELRLSWRQTIDEFSGFFIEPGVAGGYAFGFLELESDDPDVRPYEEDDSTPFWRAFLRIGTRVTGGIAGVEASYMSGGNLDFGGDASGNVNEFYIGFFGAISF